MQLIINMPTDEIGIKEFNKAFSRVQKELVMCCIRDLKIDFLSREKVLNKLKIELGKQVKKRELEQSQQLF